MELEREERGGETRAGGGDEAGGGGAKGGKRHVWEWKVQWRLMDGRGRGGERVKSIGVSA